MSSVQYFSGSIKGDLHYIMLDVGSENREVSDKLWSHRASYAECSAWVMVVLRV